MTSEEARLADLIEAGIKALEASTEERRKQREHTCTCGGNCHHEEILCPKCAKAYDRVKWLKQEEFGREYLNMPHHRVCERWAFPARKCSDFEPREGTQ